MNALEETKFLLNKYDLSAKKSLGQNFLISDEVISDIIEQSDIKNTDFVIEIGPGLGTLTSKLVEVAGKVAVVELDKDMVNIISERFKLYDNIEIIHNDILKINLEELVNRYKNSYKDIKEVKVIANLPYYISTPIIMKLIENNKSINSIIVMVQKEVADRLTAKTGGKDSGAITYHISYYTNSKKIIDVPNTCFIPIPKVNSAVIKLDLKTEEEIKESIDVKSKDLMFKIIKLNFMHRRKILSKILADNNIFSSKIEAEKCFEALNIRKDIRGEALTIGDYARISNYIYETSK